MTVLSPGTQIAQFVLQKQLGEGGQGSVWEARPVDAPEGGPTVALKIVSIRGASTATVERVRREAEALVRLSSGTASLVGCQGILQDDALGVLAIIMEKVEGQDLHAVMRDPRCTDPVKGALLLHVARALAHLHGAGVVHRDLKPQNILVTHHFFDNPDLAASVRLVDFGIAVPTGNPKPLTEVGTVIGTPAYMAPERIDPLFWQVRPGLPAEDVWAFGILAYELFFSHHPTNIAQDDGMLSAYAQRYRNFEKSREPWPPLPPQHPLDYLLRRALALRSAERFADGAALVGVLAPGGKTVTDPMMPATPEPGGPKTELAFVSPAVFGAPFSPPPAGSFSAGPSLAPYAAPGVPAVPYPHAAASARSGRSSWALPLLLLGLVGAGGAVAIGLGVMARSNQNAEGQLGASGGASSSPPPAVVSAEPANVAPTVPVVAPAVVPPIDGGYVKPTATGPKPAPKPTTSAGGTPPVTPTAPPQPTFPPFEFPPPPAPPATIPPATPPTPVPPPPTPPTQPPRPPPVVIKPPGATPPTGTRPPPVVIKPPR